jgi:hypothetical protein
MSWDDMFAPQPGQQPTWFWVYPPVEVLSWQGNTMMIYVVFDSSNCVVDSYSRPDQAAEKGTLDVLLWRLKRQWHRWFP